MEKSNNAVVIKTMLDAKEVKHDDGDKETKKDPIVPTANKQVDIVQDQASEASSTATTLHETIEKLENCNNADLAEEFDKVELNYSDSKEMDTDAIDALPELEPAGSQDSCDLVIDENLKDDKNVSVKENKPTSNDSIEPQIKQTDSMLFSKNIKEVTEGANKINVDATITENKTDLLDKQLAADNNKDGQTIAEKTKSKVKSQLETMDSKDSSEDISEVSVVTQIDAIERDAEEAMTDLEEKLEENMQIEKGVKDVIVNIIDIQNETSQQKQEATEPLQSDKQENLNDVGAANDEEEKDDCVVDITPIVPIIEIDDEDVDEDMNNISVKNKEIESVPMDIDLEPANEKIEDIVTDSGTKTVNAQKDVEVHEEPATPVDASKESQTKTETKKTEVIESDPNNLLIEASNPKTNLPPFEASTVDKEESVEDTTDEVYYNKECINYECSKRHKQYFRAPLFALAYFLVTKKRFKDQFICSECYDTALDMSEELCGLLKAKQPLILKDFSNRRAEFVEIIDSSDEEEVDSKREKIKESSSFSNADLNLIEEELENSIKKVLQDVDIQNQLTWSKTVLSARIQEIESATNQIDAELHALQKKADNIYVSLYQCPKIKIRQLQPFDLNSGRAYAPTEAVSSLAPVGDLQRPPIQINENYYAVKNKAIASWVPCKVTEQVDSPVGAQKNLKHYRVKFMITHYQMLKLVSAKHLAYYDPPKVRLPIGTRVIAFFDATSLCQGKEKLMVQSAFYPGIIAEPLKPNNKFRYLIFYDDGYTQYVYHRDVRLVCHASENVWEDVHPGSRDFIQTYLTQYSINRPMVQTQRGQSMTTESKGKWIYARVVDIDCSLIKMQFEGAKSHTEWIYRGSLRLGPVFKEYQKSLQKDVMPVSRLPRRTEPFIRYTEDEETTSQSQRTPSTDARAVAKKSVSSRQETSSAAYASVPIVRHLNNSTIYVEDENKPKGKVVYYTAKRNLPPLIYKYHDCSPDCLFKITHNLSTYSPLSKPLLSGWERMIFRQKIKKVVTYRAPCGKIMRNMKELHQYLCSTRNALNVDNFDFSHEINCLAEYVIETAIVQKRDISGGQEKMVIPLVNYYDNTMPPECKYAAQRIPTEGVNLNLNPEFLVGCDCEDDCTDKEKCSCWQLTYAGAKYGNPNTPMEEIGYQYKRLYEHVPTGIYECNSRCKCKSSCLNRVAQQSLQMKLQVFKTSNRGWGLRCLNDIPRGSFICIYAGHLLTEAKANEGGLDAGDEYFAELDYIEVAEQIKEGYESDIEPPDASLHDEEEELYAPEPDDDDDEFMPSKSVTQRSRRSQRISRSSSQNADEDSQERQVINFNPNADMNENSIRESSIRQLFGKDEACYVMDAKVIGNLGRYFNHSCSPNLFVQNVFVDTHDLRFPWVAFFSLTNIRAGTELTWNYNYEVGVVPGKVLFCQCGAPNCRLRLL